MRGVILYGPPAAGKDTITEELHRLEKDCTLFPRLKVGGGRTATYRMTTAEYLVKLRGHGDLIWENERYGATYAVDRPRLLRCLAIHTPIVHLGQADAIDAMLEATPDVRWLTVGLWCPRDTAYRRLLSRGTGDVPARLRAWDETAPLLTADITINTADVTADDAARTILAQLPARHLAAES